MHHFELCQIKNLFHCYFIIFDLCAFFFLVVGFFNNNFIVLNLIIRKTKFIREQVTLNFLSYFFTN